MAIAKLDFYYKSSVVNIGDLRLESGSLLPNVEIAYERVGPVGAPVILVCHALTGNQYAVGTPINPGWWSEFIGPNKKLDTNKYQVITTNVLGGCNGSTGPQSINPLDGKPYQGRFPFVTVRDMVYAQYRALRKLGVHHLQAVIGGSLGGMQVLEWGLLYPDYMDLLIPLAVTPYLSDYGVAYNAMGRIAITQDPKWNKGDYSPSDPPIQGLSLARMVGMVTYRSSELFNRRFMRELATPWGQHHTEITYQVESYLIYQGKKLTERFDANSYLYLLKAMDSFDIRRERGTYEDFLMVLKAPIVAISFEGDLLYPPESLEELIEQYLELGKKAYFYKIPTNYGHDGFLVEFDKFADTVIRHLSEA